MGCPVDCRIVFFSHQQLAGHPVHRVAEPVTVKVDKGLAVFAFHLDVGEDHLVDTIVIPFVMRGHLVQPLGFAGIHVTGKDGH